MDPTDDDLKQRILPILARLRPALETDGGNVELVGVAGGVVTIRLTGNCVDCSSTKLALRQGLERAVRAEVPEIGGFEILAE